MKIAVLYLCLAYCVIDSDYHSLLLKSPTYGNDIAYCLKSHCGVRGYCRQKWVLQVQIICKFSNERMCTRKKDVERLSCGFEAILY